MKTLNRMSWAALVVFAAALLVFVGGYHAGKDLARRDNAQQAN